MNEALEKYYHRYPRRPQKVVLLTDANVALSPDTSCNGLQLTGEGLLESTLVYSGGASRVRWGRREAMKEALLQFCGRWRI
eukprot:4740159-Pyramimonas_sp.AAC.1